MNQEYIIKGLKDGEYPLIKDAVNNIMAIYKINLISVNVIKLPIVRNWNVCTGRTLFGDRIVLSERMAEFLDKLNQQEREGVIAHEFSHIYNSDEDMFVGIAVALIIIGISTGVYFKSNPNIVGLIAFLFSLVLGFFGFRYMLWVSRNCEYRSDYDASIKTKNPDAYKSALIKFYLELQSKKRPNGVKFLWIFFNNILRYIFGHTHPSLKERLEYIDFSAKVLNVQALEEVSIIKMR